MAVDDQLKVLVVMMVVGGVETVHGPHSSSGCYPDYSVDCNRLMIS